MNKKIGDRNRLWNGGKLADSPPEWHRILIRLDAAYAKRWNERTSRLWNDGVYSDPFSPIRYANELIVLPNFGNPTKLGNTP